MWAAGLMVKLVELTTAQTDGWKTEDHQLSEMTTLGIPCLANCSALQTVMAASLVVYLSLSTLMKLE